MSERSEQPEQTALLQRPVTAQQAVVMALASALLGTGASSGASNIFGPSEEVADLRREVSALQEEVAGLHATLGVVADRVEQTYRVVDAAHPRIGAQVKEDR